MSRAAASAFSNETTWCIPSKRGEDALLPILEFEGPVRESGIESFMCVGFCAVVWTPQRATARSKEVMFRISFKEEYWINLDKTGLIPGLSFQCRTTQTALELPWPYSSSRFHWTDTL